MKGTFQVWRGDAAGGAFVDYATEVSEGMVALDAPAATSESRRARLRMT